MLNFAYAYKPDPVSAAIQTEAAQSERERQERFRVAWKAYQSGLKQPLTVRPGDPNDNIVLSYPRLTVDKGVSALFGEETNFQVAEKFPLGADKKPVLPANQVYLNDVWKQNKKMTRLMELGVNGGVFGHGFLQLRKEPRLKYLRIMPLCPEQMQMFWNPQDIEDIWEFRQTWGGVNPRTGKATAFRRRTLKEGLRWTVVDEESTEGDSRWRETGRTTWPYEWSPILHCQNLINPGEAWGMADIEPDVLSQNSALNFLASNTNRIIRYHAHPHLWASGTEADEIDVSVDNITVFPAENASLNKIEMEGDLSGVMAFFDRMQDAYDEQTRIPPVSRGKVEDAGALSGVALKILYGPLLEKTAVKRMLYGEMLSDLCRRLCEVAKQDVPEDIYIKWGNPMPADEKGEAEVYTLHKNLGVSTQTILDKLGYDAETEMAQTNEEADAQMAREIKTEQATMQSRFDRGE